MADTQKRNRLDELQNFCEWLEHKTTSLEGKHIDLRGEFEKGREQTQEGFRTLAWLYIALAALVTLLALLLASRL